MEDVTKITVFTHTQLCNMINTLRSVRRNINGDLALGRMTDTQICKHLEGYQLGVFDSLMKDTTAHLTQILHDFESEFTNRVANTGLTPLCRKLKHK